MSGKRASAGSRHSKAMSKRDRTALIGVVVATIPSQDVLLQPLYMFGEETVKVFRKRNLSHRPKYMRRNRIPRELFSSPIRRSGRYRRNCAKLC